MFVKNRKIPPLIGVGDRFGCGSFWPFLVLLNRHFVRLSGGGHGDVTCISNNMFIYGYNR